MLILVRVVFCKYAYVSSVVITKVHCVIIMPLQMTLYCYACIHVHAMQSNNLTT